VEQLASTVGSPTLAPGERLSLSFTALNSGDCSVVGKADKRVVGCIEASIACRVYPVVAVSECISWTRFTDIAIASLPRTIRFDVFRIVSANCCQTYSCREEGTAMPAAAVSAWNVQQSSVNATDLDSLLTKTSPDDPVLTAKLT
jgi:hypothetical protein